MSKAARAVPYAHIRGKVNYGLGEYALCGASIYPSDFAFDDAGHALNHYGSANSYLRACQACLDEAERRK